jgi:hypothetical protein
MAALAAGFDPSLTVGLLAGFALPAGTGAGFGFPFAPFRPEKPLFILENGPFGN